MVKFVTPSGTCRRKIYDETGSLQDSEDLAGSEFNELYNFYRGMYRTVDENEIEAFTADFRGSEEEKRVLLKYYEQFHGNMEKVCQALVRRKAASEMLGFDPSKPLTDD